MSRPILYDSHMHTPLCKHARGNPEEYAAVAEERGLKGIIITCHAPMPNNDWSPRLRMREDQFDEYINLVEKARNNWFGRIDVRLGLESEYVPGFENYFAQLHTQADLHYVLGSIHPQMDEYKERYYHGDAFELHQIYYQHLAMAAETGLYDALSHPDIVKNMFPKEWRIDRLENDIFRALDRIAATGIAMELNTSGLLKRIREMNPNRFMLEAMFERDIPIVVGSDAHTPKRVAADFDTALTMLADVGYTHISYFLDRQRYDVPITVAQASLDPSQRVRLL